MNDVVFIDRTLKFKPTEFIDEGWSFWKGPQNGSGIVGDPEEDKRSLSLYELNVSRITLDIGLRPGEMHIIGEERLRRVGNDKAKADLGIFLFFWNYPNKIPISFRERTKKGKVRCIFFDGQILREPKYGRRYSLYICSNSSGWYWNVHPLSSFRDESYPSAIITV